MLGLEQRCEPARLAVIWAMGLVLLCACLPGTALEAGAAKVEITPELGVPMNGYADRLGRGAVAKHDPLWARALFLSDGTTSVFLVTTDLYAISRDLRDRVLELAPTVTPSENIILTATHTHNGPGAMDRPVPRRLISGRFMPEVLDETAEGIAASMREAYASRRRAAIGYGTAKHGVLSANRTSGGVFDEQIGVLRVDDADGNAIAIVANFSAIPANVPEADRYAYSADYPGFYNDFLEGLASQGCVAMFLNGSDADQAIANPEGKEGWPRLESVGRLLAIRVKEVANDITYTAGNLRIGFREAGLPPTMTAGPMPASTFLQVLEIDDLLLTFLPGSPSVRIGHELRRRALERGYAAQFTVGMANDSLMYFLAREDYALDTPEARHQYFGPRMDEWLYRQYDTLMSKGTASSASSAVVSVPIEKVEGGLRLSLEGSSYAMGVQRGRAFAEDIGVRYEARVVDLVRADEHRGQGWGLWPPFLDPTPLIMPELAAGARLWLAGLPPSTFEELEGMAHGAGLPFDAVWLLQNTARLGISGVAATPAPLTASTTIAVLGDRAGADDLLVGHNLGFVGEELPVVFEMRPENGHRFVQVGFTWNAGVLSGMNDAGLVVCVERLPSRPSGGGLALEMVLRDVLQNEGLYNAAVARLRAQPGLRGSRVLVAGMEDGASRAAVLDWGETATLREAGDGLLLGCDVALETESEGARARYARVTVLLEEERIVGLSDLKRVLADKGTGRPDADRIWSATTQHSIIFEPRARNVHVAFPRADGGVGTYTTISLAEGPGHE